MATLQDLLDDLNDRLGDDGNADGVGVVKKTRWLNNGIKAMWPRVYVDVADTFDVEEDTYEYALSSDFDGLAEITRIDGEDALGRYLAVDQWALDTRDSKTLSFPSLPVVVGNAIRVAGVRPVQPMVATTTTIFAAGLASSNVFTATASHGLSAGDEVRFLGAASGTGLTAPNTYYVLASGLTATEFKLSSTLEGTEIDVTVNYVTAVFSRDGFSTAADYDGPAGTEELPVLYAMGIASGRLVDPRLPYTRYSTVNAQNGVDLNEIMNASQFWFAQFELLLDRLGMPWPTSGLN